jgi:hypothetical protein
METNGNGYVKPIGVGVAIILLATAVIGSATQSTNVVLRSQSRPSRKTLSRTPRRPKVSM